ncbi:hypothetical protein ASPWEDRAFT_42558 [Aspergillus wentii DTO 134E9]|uniref:Proline racemase n=1 Tax=Aspergillus wentii DTO 134E9 TaxID=1073089 RepID=A0A1L9RI98_ASPWE|nr:uncharacterized protein ASPWEDRAFT_42558 [Aspergillus wentii DTO 134E9]KAI9925895.1 hypothetical protein MW887_005701 [Aspergillus wentii]OJJ34577.1 hypothetical protein ASPWEDRAFT_42558 [Aspergillus wentii DTO 134E9]
MRFSRTLSVVDAHAAGEVGDVIIGGVLDVPGKTMYEKMVYFETNADHIRKLLLNEPRGRPSMCCNLILPPTNPAADAGLLIMESDEYVPMSGSNTICATTVLLETGMITMQEPTTQLTLDTAAGLITVTAGCDRSKGKCTSVTFDNIPAFVFALDYPIDIPGLGTINVDIAWGGMIFVIVDVATVGLKIESQFGAQLVEMGEMIKRAVRAKITPTHPENSLISGISACMLTAPLEDLTGMGGIQGKRASNTVVVSPGRLDRSPCGAGTSARMAVLHARGLLQENEPFYHQSITGTEFACYIRGTTKVGKYDAVLPTLKGTAWITGFRQVVLDPTDPFPEGFRVGDFWHVGDQPTA